MLRRNACVAAFVVVGALVLIATAGCGSGSTATRAPDAVYVSTYNLVFEQSTVNAPADRTFQVWFENRDAVPHNVNLVDDSGTSVAKGDVFSGPSAQALQVPVLTTGTYKLLCDVHPDMHAELIVN